MCIRDSVENLGELGGVALADGKDDAFADLAADRIAQRVLPVSYTHLRAHETVLDLVCRLLLEKKNNPQPPPASPNTDSDTINTRTQTHPLPNTNKQPIQQPQ